MSKTLYIETNEEITSVVDRIKNINDSEVVLVIPKKASILQSILNLKILRKQLDRAGKEAVIVTSDKIGRNLASRADFIVKQKLEADNSSENKTLSVNEASQTRLKVLDIIKKGNDNAFSKLANTDSNKSIAGFSAKKDINGNNSNKNQSLDDAVNPRNNNNSEKNDAIEAPLWIKRKGVFADDSSETKKIMILPSFGKKLFLIVSFATFLVAGIVLFLVLPTAAIIIEPKTQLITQEIDLIVDKSITSVDSKNLKIPGDLIEVSKETTKEFSATGKKQIKEKASGTITVYNDWDSQSQTLVENTRFVSDDGKLFKSDKTIVVPGFKRLSGQDVPGSATITVVADEPGEEYNIKASKFSIPGFKGTVKYEKIYGVSTEAMTGGRVEQITVVGDDDFNRAKKTIEQNLREEVTNELKAKTSEKAVIAEEGIFLNKAEFTSSKKIGEEAKSFSITLKVNGSAMVFNEEDTVSIAKENIKAPFSEYTLISDPKLIYGKADTDLKNGRMSLKVYSETTIASALDKKDILDNVKGKNADDLKKYFANVSEVSNVNVKFWPSWVKSIPRIESKINIDIK